MLFKSAITAALLAVVSAQRYQKVPATFNATAWESLKSCVNATEKHYDVAVDDGALVVVPQIGAAEIDPSTTDPGLRYCLARHSNYLELAADGTRDLTSNLTTIPFDTASTTWAQQQGVLGIALVLKNGTTGSQNLSAASLDKRTTAYYFAYLDQYGRDCRNAGLDTVYSHDCVSPGPPFQSVAFGNADDCHFLQAMFWFHHKCAVDYPAAERRASLRFRYADPGKDSLCYTGMEQSGHKNTYSFMAQYFDCTGKCC